MKKLIVVLFSTALSHQTFSQTTVWSEAQCVIGKTVTPNLKTNMQVFKKYDVVGFSTFILVQFKWFELLGGIALRPKLGDLDIFNSTLLFGIEADKNLFRGRATIFVKKNRLENFAAVEDGASGIWYLDI